MTAPSITPPAVRRRGGESTLLAAEVALAGVTASVAIGFARLFTGSGFLAPLLATVAVAHALTAVVRRRGLHVVIATAVQLVAAALLLTWLHHPSTTWWGLPTARTWTAARLQLADAFAPFRELVAPVEITPGFEMTMGIVAWVIAIFADAAAFRGRAPVQAVVPHAGVVFATAVFARGEGAALAGGVFAAAVVFHFVCNRAWRSSERRWVGDDARRGPLWSIAVGAAVTVVVGLAATVVGPRTPGSSSDPLVDLRAIGRGAGPIEVGNPLVGVSNLLGPQSDQVVFTVRSDRPHYWRLTALEEFDGQDQQWKTRRRYDEVGSGERLAPARPGGVSFVEETASFELTGLGGVWLPTAYEPHAVDADIEVRHDRESSSLIAGGRRSVPSTRYSVTAQIPAVDEPWLRSRGPRTAQVDSIYLDLPEVSPVVSATARQIVASADAASMYDEALALQAYFRAFTYDAAADYSRGADPVSDFLVARRGFCQQFASTFALMARSLGIPARVAVGFTYGDLAPAPSTEAAPDDDEATPSYVVRGRNAHAWPEVYIPGAGWIAFEPTPNRGNPDAAAYTGVDAAQERPADPEAATAPTTTVAGDQPAPEVPDSGELDLLPEGDEDPEASVATEARRVDLWPAALWAFLGAVVVLATARAAWTVLRRRRRRGHRDSPAHRVRAAWVETCDWLELLTLRPGPAETPVEFARRARHRGRVPDDIDVLAALETARIFGPGELDESAATAAERAAGDIRVAVRERVDRRTRLLVQLGWSRRN